MEGQRKGKGPQLQLISKPPPPPPRLINDRKVPLISLVGSVSGSMLKNIFGGGEGGG
jgi:hypothetical protein